MKFLKTERIYLRKASFEDWFNSRSYIYSKEMLKYEVPDRHIPSIQEEEEFWTMDVKSGKYLIFSICLNSNQIIGFIHAFAFNKEKSNCETGIKTKEQLDYIKS